MSDRRYFMAIFTPKSWAEFLTAGGRVAGFRAASWPLARKVRTGDALLAYVKGVSCFVGVLGVTGDAFVDSEPIWSDDAYPLRIPVVIEFAVPVEMAADIRPLVPRFSWYSPDGAPTAWQGHVQNALRRWDAADAAVILEALERVAGHGDGGA